MKRRSKEQWQELFAQHETSGLSAVVFCQQHGLCSRFFSLRRKQLTKVVEKVETGFARVHIKPDVKRDVSSRVASSDYSQRVTWIKR